MDRSIILYLQNVSFERAGAPAPEKCSENCTTDGKAAEKQVQDADKPSPDTFMCDFRVRYQIRVKQCELILSPLPAKMGQSSPFIVRLH